MKKIFLTALVMVLSLFALRLTNVNAAVNYEFTTDGNATVDGNVYTLTKTRALLTTDVSAMNLDVTSLYVSVMYNFSDDAEGFETKVNGVDANGAAVEQRDAATVINKTTKPWNATEHVVTDDYILSTIKIDNYTKDLQKVTGIVLRLKGVEGTTFELLGFEVTADGNHSLLGNVGGEEEPDDGTLKFSGVTTEATATITKNAKDEQVISYDVTPGWNTFDIAVKNYDANLPLFEIKFTASEDTYVCFSIDGNINWDLGHKKYTGGKVSTQVIDVTSWDLPSSFTISMYIDAEQAVSATKTVTIHSIGFKTPEPEPEGMYITAPIEHSINCSKNEDGSYTVTYNNDNPSWRNVEIQFKNHEVEYDVIKLTVELTEKTNLGIRLYWTDAEGAETYADIRNHHTELGVAKTTGTYELVYLTKAFGAQGLVLSKMELYFDPNTAYTTNKGDVTATIVSYELAKSADLNLQELDFSVANATFDYNGQRVELPVTCAQDLEFVYEYRRVSAEENVSWAQGTPRDAGEYQVRVSFMGSLTYDYKTVTCTVVINKVKGSVSADDVTVDAQTRVVTVADGVEASTDEEFTEGSEVLDGDVVQYGTVIYYRFAGDNNYTPSDVLSLTVERPVEEEETPTPVPTPGESETPTTPNNPETPVQPGGDEEANGCGGCDGSIVVSAIAMLALCGVAVFCRKRKED